MTIKIITASAGSGKTTTLSEELDRAIASGNVRPEAIIATTFTRHAAAELIERARGCLLKSQRVREAHQLLAARIGTVNAVCGGLVTDFAFELGLSPSLRVLDEPSADLELKRALASVVSSEVASELFSFKYAFSDDFDWILEVRRLIEGARSNGLDADSLAACAARSKSGLDACLGPAAADGSAIERGLSDALEAAIVEIDIDADGQKNTSDYVELLQKAKRDLSRGRLKWGDWAKLGNEKPGVMWHGIAQSVATAAGRHIEHPRLRERMHRLVDLLFDIAGRGLRAYQEHKLALGVIDFVDQESLALELLKRNDVRDALRGQIDLVLIDEFQDTSPLQLAIFLELAALARESIWVGDQKQAIYGFRGTDPALMDAMIESLTSTTTDPDLVADAVAALGQKSKLESLDKSYRSRPELVDLTSDLFAIAFDKHGIPPERTKLISALAAKDEPKGLGPIIEHWPLQCDKRESKAKLAAATAAGVQELIASKPRVRDRRTGAARDATIADIAVLCRTNEHCQLVANSLAELGVPAVVPRLGLLSTAEGHLVSAALRLYIDSRDSVAIAEIARLIDYAGRSDQFFSAALAAPYGRSFANDPIVTAVAALRTASPDLEPSVAVAAVIDAANLRELCASWGNAEQRLSNLDALRAHATSYVNQAESRREAATLVGMLSYFAILQNDGFGWRASSSDEQALLSGSAAVTVSTWHAAKGREWPITVLFGLESLREPRAFGVHIESDAVSFDIRKPLEGRWLRFWPNPYSSDNQKGPIKAAYARSAEFNSVKARVDKETLRLLYVGWTRARDRLIFAASKGKFLGGLVGSMSRLDGTLISEPAAKTGEAKVTWGPRALKVQVKLHTAGAPVETDSIAGEIAIGTVATPYVAARLLPSKAPEEPCTIGALIEIGPRLTLRGNPEMGSIGDAMHGFFAVDRAVHTVADRVARASGLLASYRVETHLEASEVVDASTRLGDWLRNHLGATHVYGEWPVTHRRDDGTLVSGTADLVVRTQEGLVLIDHKTFAGTREQALARLPKYSGQLSTYARALEAASGLPIAAMWVHLPMLGIVVPVTPSSP